MMKKVFWGALFVALFRLSTSVSTSVSRFYAAEIYLDVRVLQENLLTEYDNYSLIKCSIMCGPGCTYFGVNLQRKKCRVYTGCHLTNSAVPKVGWRYFFQESEENFPPMDCKRLLADGFTESGFYTIYPWYHCPVYVFCDMDTRKGGWTVIQRRVDGLTDFDRTWKDYREGFGSVHSYWIGNDVIHQLTKNKPSLYVSITLTNGTTLYQQYSEFSVNNEKDKYRLYLAGPTDGTLGDRMLDTGNSFGDLSGRPFTTKDRANGMDLFCVSYFRGGGCWFNLYCSYTYLNGPWSPGSWVDPWYPPLKNGDDITETLMMIKPH